MCRYQSGSEYPRSPDRWGTFRPTCRRVLTVATSGASLTSRGAAEDQNQFSPLQRVEPLWEC
jgi:hypothetical protein